MKYRLNKFIAHAGVCSRRKAAELVKDGYIKVNGEVEKNPAIEVSEKDVIEYLGKRLKPVEDKIYLLLNKPKNVITTMQDERGRKTVWDIVKEKVKHKINPVGRLDRNTTGLLLMTNDGELAQHLSHPKTTVKKIYQVVLDRAVEEKHMDAIKEGLVLEDGIAEVDEVSYIKDMPANYVGIQLHSGKNRIIRRIFEHLKYDVVALDRVYYAGLTKKDLPRGWSRFLTEKECIMLKHFIK
jgi:23S rRNA pseudouridine2605 synthase